MSPTVVLNQTQSISKLSCQVPTVDLYDCTCCPGKEKGHLGIRLFFVVQSSFKTAYLFSVIQVVDVAGGHHRPQRCIFCCTQDVCLCAKGWEFRMIVGDLMQFHESGY